ncbi:hypothetical protein CEXT_629241 [Caerostris extrusa]|uniref:Uncharacterized protein n=1 Tax=Caerostris extrusa TaxID=172846 RepID=A0AAV4NH29_CAEEX|nr:hypothetical protein CEXT_629241 [Caerostris extrusa]
MVERYGYRRDGNVVWSVGRDTDLYGFYEETVIDVKYQEECQIICWCYCPCRHAGGNPSGCHGNKSLEWETPYDVFLRSTSKG